MFHTMRGNPQCLTPDDVGLTGGPRPGRVARIISRTSVNSAPRGWRTGADREVSVLNVRDLAHVHRDGLPSWSQQLHTVVLAACAGSPQLALESGSGREGDHDAADLPGVEHFCDEGSHSAHVMKLTSEHCAILRIHPPRLRERA